MPATVTAASPTSGPISLSMTRDKTSDFAIAVFEADGVTPQDLTGAILLFYAQIGTVLISKSSASSGGITINSVTGGLATLQIEPADTAAMPFGGTISGPCEITMQLSGENYDIAAGTLTVYSNVSTP
jgi:hypothetical protein